MSRPVKYRSGTILDATLSIALERGPANLSVSRVATAMGAPSGSIYHRFPSRDSLVGELWLRAVERFQEGFLEAVSDEDPLRAAVSAATHVVRWSRSDFDHARLLIVHRSEDFIGVAWPDELRQRNKRQRLAATRAIRSLSNRLGATDTGSRGRVKFAVVSMPYGAVRPALSAGQRPQAYLEGLVKEAAQALLRPLTASGDRT